MKGRADLSAKVKAVNAANKSAKELYTVLAGIFAPLVGQLVLAEDDSLLDEYKKLIPKLPCTPQLRCYSSSTYYSLSWTIKTFELIGSGNVCTYHEVVVYVGEINGRVLTKLCPERDFRSDYTVEEVAAKLETVELAKQAYDDAKAALHPFDC